MEIKFGPAGNSESFYEDGLRSALEAPKWLNQKGLTAYEYQCGHGVRISDDAAGDLGAEAKKYDVTLSVHAPYYISLSSVEEEAIEEELSSSALAAGWVRSRAVMAPPKTTAAARVIRI